ncbi:flagellin [Fervidobacterium thailandense]|uniref:Flagellin n=1 Tax=Fervidobacterium thailandense TaxID=1008305 RepID=A0A1E3G362_9BACT|nr:flagellin [Fervidobacterium thailandense]ODN30600.1 hypothetical protein A4H02_05015 [Fervidobacterium thailandense]
MRINHNLSALNAWRQITLTDSDMKKTLERLSSGLKINRASDDAAGLAISEKMRGQIRGLEMAVKNAQDAISLIQTAEGALQEIHAILQRMRELAVQAASDTNTNVDRENIQAEIDQLREEINRIARATEFNTKKLLDGKLESFRAYADLKVVTGGNFDLNVSTLKTTLAASVTLFSTSSAIQNNSSIALDLAGMRIGALSVIVSGKTVHLKFGSTSIGSFTVGNDTTVNKTITWGDLKFELTISDASTGIATVRARVNNLKVGLATTKSLSSDDVEEGTYILEVGQFKGNSTSNLDVRLVKVTELGLSVVTVVDYSLGRLALGEFALSSTGVLSFVGGKGVLFSWTTTAYSITDFGGAQPLEQVIDSGVVRAESKNYGERVLVFQIGANEGVNMIAGIDKMTADALGITPDAVKVTDQNSAERSIMIIDGAIHKVSSARAALGAIQNRLEHTIANLGVAAENLTAAESRIRDADMAKEMMQFTKYQILMQSGMAMLAQSNALPQNVLQLLRG